MVLSAADMEVAVTSQATAIGWALVVEGIVGGMGFGAIWFSWSRIYLTTPTKTVRSTVVLARILTILLIPTVVVGLILVLAY